jgi:hypothetical protein
MYKWCFAGHLEGNRCLTTDHSRLWGHREGMAHCQEREENSSNPIHGNLQTCKEANIIYSTGWFDSLWDK